MDKLHGHLVFIVCVNPVADMFSKEWITFQIQNTCFLPYCVMHTWESPIRRLWRCPLFVKKVENVHMIPIETPEIVSLSQMLWFCKSNEIKFRIAINLKPKTIKATVQLRKFKIFSATRSDGHTPSCSWCFKFAEWDALSAFAERWRKRFRASTELHWICIWHRIQTCLQHCCGEAFWNYIQVVRGNKKMCLKCQS